ncbi:MAG: APC family permease [Fimbriiglobus sp.]|jgi:amino acid transporter|nr:APC family permease [Fimbriiglobus sp.]
MSDTAPPVLPRILGPWLAAGLVVGTVIGTGVFKKAAAVAAPTAAPEFGLAIGVWVGVGVLTLLGALAFAEVAVRFPRAGGNYVFLREAYGRPMAFLSGWVDFGINRGASVAALASMFTESLANLIAEVRPELASGFGYWPQRAFTVGLIAVLAVVNARGTLLGARLQFGVTILKVASIVVIALLPLVVLLWPGAPSQPTTAHMVKPWPDHFPLERWVGLGSAAVAVLWAYHGWMNLGPMAEEITRPQRNIPLALLAGVGCLIVLYVSANLAYYTALGPIDMVDARDGTTVAREFCRRLIGPAGAMAASLAVMVSVFGAVNGNILVGPRLPYAMAQDRLAPGIFGRLHARFRTPTFATALLAGWSIFMVLALGVLLQTNRELFHLWEYKNDAWQVATDEHTGQTKTDTPFDMLTDFVIFGSVAFDTLAVAALFVLRRKHADRTAALPYKCWGYPVVPALYCLAMAGVMFSMFLDPEKRWKAFVGLGFIAVGAGVYWLAFGRKRSP